MGWRPGCKPRGRHVIYHVRSAEYQQSGKGNVFKSDQEGIAFGMGRMGGGNGVEWREGWESWLMCLPKIYMNASQDEEVKDGARSGSAKGHAETKPRWRFPLAGTGRMKKARIDMEVR